MTLPSFEWDSKKFNEALRTAVSTQVRQAARAFVRKAVVKVPVDTGQARGTFLPLGRFLRVSVPIGGASPKANKSSNTGSSGTNQLLFRFTTEKNGVYFEIEPQLFYFWFNDFFAHNYPNGQLPTPWQSLESGKKAFLDYMQNVAPTKLPKLKDFVIMSFFDLNANGRFAKRG
jgi:hypothetical protein